MGSEMSFGDIYRGRRVLLTGHTGFKGSWLAAWLEKLGAELCGISLPPPTAPNHFDLIRFGGKSCFVDLRDRGALADAVRSFAPEIVFHLAAQALVLPSYEDPVATFECNVMGTLHLLDALRYGNGDLPADAFTRPELPSRRFYVAVLPAAPFEPDPLPGRSAKRSAKTVVYGVY